MELRHISRVQCEIEIVYTWCLACQVYSMLWRKSSYHSYHHWIQVIWGEIDEGGENFWAENRRDLKERAWPRAHTSVAGSIPVPVRMWAGGNQLMCLSDINVPLSLPFFPPPPGSLPFSLKSNIYIQEKYILTCLVKIKKKNPKERGSQVFPYLKGWHETVGGETSLAATRCKIPPQCK